MKQPSASSLALLFEPFRYGRPERTVSIQLETAHTLVFDDRAQIDALLAEFTTAHPAADARLFEKYLRVRIRIIQAIAAFVAAHIDFNAASFIDDAALICSNTLAFHLADNDERAALQILFRNIATYVAEQAPSEELRVSIRRSALSPISVRALSEWLANNLTIVRQASQDNTLFAALSGQLLTHTRSDELLSLSLPDVVVPLAALWMDATPFWQLNDYLAGQEIKIGARNPWVEGLVGLCESGFGFDGAMLFSTIADLVEPTDADLAGDIALVGKRLKYGLPGRAAITFYEIGFADRVVSMALAALFPHVVDRSTAILGLRARAAETRDALAGFPSYFAGVLNELIA
ncbi:hypothetical protein [Caulobacter sp. Root1472]|uniref:hypothetical protein n=1 Tax=Caulobacter sp. Root1472 TaxID=1736470 RepID=UPI0006F7E847|nr:hypothetical protein [Caulobacter sp. Root1472]KQZ30994.1 hypothetical protein ASD47_17685 [Caulobacter sp. Root1472]